MSNWSLGEIMDSRYTDLYETCKKIQYTGTADVRGVYRFELPPILFEFKQYGEFNDPYYEVRCWSESDSHYVHTGWLTFSADNCWCYEQVVTETDNELLTSDELRVIADKLDELNAKLEKERTMFDKFLIAMGGY